MVVESWFSVPIVNYDFRGEELDAIQSEIQNAISQVNKSNLSMPWGDLTFSTFSHDQNVNDIKTCSMTRLEKAIHNLANAFCSQINYPNALTIKESWLNFSTTGGFQYDHKHPGYKLSGCYYYQTTGNDGNIRFENPNPVALSGGFPFDKINADGVVYTPQVGRILLFPSWLTHRVEVNKTNSERISLAFNLS